MKRTSTIAILGALVSLFVSGCDFPVFPGSRDYRPISAWEQAEFEKAKRDVYPDDVRKDVTKYQSVVVAWPGIILQSEVHEREDNIEIVFLLEHHYYDWIEDFSIQRARIFLSPRGEGLFQTSWYLRKEANLSDARKAAAPGNLAIVYGIPERTEDSIMILKSSYVRGIDKEWYTTDVLDYGREGEPGELKQVPLR